MQYLLLIYHNENEWANLADQERGRIIQEYFTLTDQLRESGQLRGGSPLQPTTTAKTVRVRDGRSLVTDGPFAETKEQLGGYYLVEVASEEEAAAIAARIPGARYGSIEVRALPPMPVRQP